MKRIFLLFMSLLALSSLFSLDVQQDIVRKSEQYIGSRYSTGGVKPPEFDCSGFVGYIMRPFVPGLPRLSRDMAAAGKKITKAELLPGDLVFFATTAVPGAVSHVALYIGQDSIIHAISDGPDRGVNITALSCRYWKEHYHSAARVLPLQTGKSAEKEGAAADVAVKPIRFAKGAYSGALRNGEPEGEGTMKLNNGDVYTGSFARGKFNGTGTYTFLNGEKYEGLFKDDLFLGKGKAADAKETYIQKAASPWDTWTGYVGGDYGQWKAKQDKDFDAFKNAYGKDAEQKAFEEWQKTSR